MKAIILAAGMGKRLQAVSGGKPKSMIEISNQSIIHRQIASCRQAGIKNFVIVLGYRQDQMKNHILEILRPEDVVFVHNPIYDQTNTLYSLWLAGEHFTEDFVYFNADVLFAAELLFRISGDSRYSQLLLETKHCGEEEVKMIIDDNGKILEIGKQLPRDRCAGEFIGIGKFKREVLDSFSRCLQLGVDRGQQNNYFEYAVNLLCREHYLQAVSTEGLPCVEIDFPEDLERARQLFGGEGNDPAVTDRH